MLYKKCDMKRTDNFFLIHNYNTVPEQLLEYCDQYLIVDCSDDGSTREELKRRNYRFVTAENTGHNLTTYFHYFEDHYDELPERIALLKGNIIGRHVTREYFERACGNHYFTYLYQEPSMWDRYGKNKENNESGPLAMLVSECQYAERNNSWYMHQSHEYRYFYDMDDFIRFIYKNPVIPRYLTFAPGGCYIVQREQIRSHSPVFYRNLNKVMEYRREANFPAEAFLVERLMPWIFESNLEVNPWMEDEQAFDTMLERCERSVNRYRAWNSQHLKRLKLWMGAKEPVFLEEENDRQ